MFRSRPVSMVGRRDCLDVRAPGEPMDEGAADTTRAARDHDFHRVGRRRFMQSADACRPSSPCGCSIGTAEHQIKAGPQFHVRQFRREEIRLHQMAPFRGHPVEQEIGRIAGFAPDV